MKLANINPSNFNYDYDQIEKDKINFDYYSKYYRLHTDAILPTKIKIDIDLFRKEIVKYHNLFRQWGNNRNYLPRYGISLVNYTGDIYGENDIACSPLDQYNAGVKKEDHLTEFDFNKKTELFANLKSLDSLNLISEFMLRSNILLWHKHANFIPHIDTAPLNNYNLRLWGTDDPSNYNFYFLNKQVNMDDIEPGRIYLIDTTIWHWAEAKADWIYTFFISTTNSIECFETIKKILL